MKDNQSVINYFTNLAIRQYQFYWQGMHNYVYYFTSFRRFVMKIKLTFCVVQF